MLIEFNYFLPILFSINFSGIVIRLDDRAKVSDEVHGRHGWVHVRQSVHNPNIALNMQSMVIGGCQAMAIVFRDRYITFYDFKNHSLCQKMMS